MFSKCRIALCWVLLASSVGCLNRHKATAASGGTVVVPTTSAPERPQLQWQVGIGEVNDPPSDCAVVPAAPKGTRSEGSKQGEPSPAKDTKRGLPSSWQPDYDIFNSELKTFSGRVIPKQYHQGSKLYRVIGERGNPAGAYWSTKPPPSTEAEWRSKLAVLAEWNGASCVERYIVGKEGLKAWVGRVAPQKDGIEGRYLPGGGSQVFVPSASRQIDRHRIQYSRTLWVH